MDFGQNAGIFKGNGAVSIGITLDSAGTSATGLTSPPGETTPVSVVVKVCDDLVDRQSA